MQGQDLTPISMLPSCFQHGLAILREDIPQLLGMNSKANRGCGYFIDSPGLVAYLTDRTISIEHIRRTSVA